MSQLIGSSILAIVLSQAPAAEVEGFTPAVQQEALQATVRVVNQKKNAIGAGVILNRSGAITFVLTAAHVVDSAERVDVHVFTSKSYPKPAQIYESAAVIVRARDKQPDLAVLRVIGYGGASQGLKLCPMRELPDESKFSVLSVGCGDNHVPTLRSEQVIDTVHAKKRNDSHVSSYFRTDQKPSSGRSGGPLVDSRGRLLGICSGGDNGRAFYCHLEDIHQFLRAHGLHAILNDQP
jgi:S1-C subfamily serine protease